MLNLQEENKYQQLLEKNKKTILSITIIRVILALAFIISFICFFTLDYSISFLIVGIILIGAFFVFIFLTSKYYSEEKYLKNVILCFNKHKNRRENNINNSLGFFDKGLDFKRNLAKSSLRVKYLMEDIDIFGENSLYQNICSAKSLLGREELAKSLIETTYLDKRKEWPQKIYELGNNERVIELEAALMENNCEFDMEYKDYLATITRKFAEKPKRKWGLIGLYLLDLLIIVLSIIGVLPLYSLVLVIILNLYYSTLFSDDLNKVNSTKISNSLFGYSNCLRILTKQDLTFIDEKYTKDYFYAERKKLTRLVKLWQIMSYKNNIIFKLLLNSLICFEGLFQQVYNKMIVDVYSLDQTFNLISNLENMVSLSNVVADYEACVPKNSEKINFVNLINPLVKNCVPNSFNYQNGVVLTGSNMSGKTTFLRTIAINIILKMAGGCVCASEFSSPNYEVYTSLRVKDEMSEGVSTFYAEIAKIREMLSSNSDNLKKLCLIDEIFKGTNTLDRIYGATKLIEKLQTINSDFLVSTHDFELCDLNNIDNYHFSELYDDLYTKISFDYKIKKGKSVSTNAIFLLKSSGII